MSSSQNAENRMPQDKVIAQHVLRGKFLRKYLHANSIARKLKETEHMLSSSVLHVGASSKMVQKGKPNALVWNKSLAEKVGKLDEVDEDAAVVVEKPASVLRRVSSIDKAINKTVKRIRRLSGMADPADTSTTNKQPSLAPAPHLKTKFASLKAISESQQPGKMSSRQQSKGSDNGSEVQGDDDDGEDDDNDFGLDEVKINPPSAHILRICQHVMAKRAIKSFLHQEMSVIHQIEASLRDDETMQRHHTSTPSSSIGMYSNHSTIAPGESGGRRPIKAMSTDLVDAVTMYLNEGDQHMTVDELFYAALEAEKQKLWKRAILLASACIVIDREFLQAVLLRARCCRRIGLWTQAIKDLGHALLLRPEEHRLFLLRAFLLVKMVDMNNALMDVNRALLLHPKSTEALLLRADIFHRQNNIGASLQDLTTALNLDPSCWRAYYDRATIRIRAIEGDEQSLSYHWEHMKYEQLLVSIIEDYTNAVRKGCKMVEVVETVGDLTVRLLEFTGDADVLRQVIHNLSHLLQILSIDHRDSFYVAHHQIGGNDDNARPTAIERELLIAAIHAQRGRLFVLFNDKTNAAIEFDHAVVSEYHYPVAHFYRGAFAALVSKDDDVKTNLQHLTKSIALDPTIAGAYTVRGALHLRDLKFNNALQDFKAAVATDPTLYEVWLQIALIYLNHYHDCDACIKACTSALTNDSCLARALYLRGEAYKRQGNTTAALKDYGRLTIAQPDDRWAQCMRGRLLLHLKLARPALYSFILFMEQGSADGDKRAHFLCGMAFKILSRFQKAVDEFQRAVSLNPTSENLVLLSESLHSMGDTENSLRVSDKVIFADPGSFKGYVRRAQLLVSVGQFQHAMSEYDKALFLAPKQGRVYYERGIVQMQLYMRWRIAWQLNFDPHTTAHGASGGAQKKKKSKKLSPFYPQLSAMDVEAVLGADSMNDELTVCKMLKTLYAGSISDFSKCMRLEPLLADPYVDRAELYALCEEYDKAFRDFECAIERNPKCVRAYVNLGVLKCQFAAFAAAIDDFDKAVKYDPKLSLVFFNRGVAYHKLSLWKQAEVSYDQCIALVGGKGRYIDAHRNRAITKCQLGDFEGALRDFDDVRQCAPDDDQLHGGLGYVLLQLGRYVDAAKSFATYGRLSRDTFGDSGNAYFNLANQQQSLDNATHLTHLKTALRFYLRTARIQPCNNDVRLNIANCLRKQREFAKAIMQCDVVNSMMPRHHASLESKAFVYFEMHQFDDAIECMSAAIRACVASSSNLGNMFYAFTNDSIRRNALERKTVTSRDGARREASTPSSSLLLSNRPNPTPALEPKDSSAVGAAENADRLTRVTLPASEIIVSGPSKQLLSLYMINRGILYEQQGDFEQARQNYRDAIHFDALSVHAQICMGTLHLLEAKFDDSIAHLMKALAMDVNSGIAHINMGVAYLCVNKVADALTHFDAAIKLVPNCGYAFANKAVALARTGDLAQAEYNFKRAIEALPSRKEFYLARGKIIAQQKRLQDAMVDFSTALFLGYEGKL
uniref:UDP-N-acetylglucosamine--peptide N-acetylglucosaminyltransferase SPINDLY n=1 Tax=Globisporangium ultimum (strain ATCC 200006 / CBS 805.95 / DAOM BR144) TaxID=431595 RepID=K3WUR2_GLOUD